MKKIQFEIEKDGFYGSYYKNPKQTFVAVIAMMGDDCNDYLARKGVQWLHSQGVNVMAISPAPKDYSCHNLPIERFEAVIKYLQKRKNKKIGIIGASTTGMMALLAASFYPEITMTIAISPSDFVMEGFYQENGIERPGEGESTVSYKGEPLPYLPYAYRHPKYDQKIKEEAKQGKNMVASRKMFERSEQLHPVTDKERIKVEKIHGTVVLIGAEDDCLWDTCKYIRRMNQVVKDKEHTCKIYPLTYQHGTHFLFPESMMKKLMPLGSGILPWVAFRAARQFPKECKASRMDVDRKVKKLIRRWIKEA